MLPVGLDPEPGPPLAAPDPVRGRLRHWLGMKYRLASHDDAEAIRTIYNREVLGSTVTFDLVPRTAEDQLAWMDEHSGAHPAVVAVDDHDRVCGFGSLSPYRPRPAYRTTVEDSVYVDRTPGPGGGPGPARASWSRLAGAHGFHAVMARIVGGHEASIGCTRPAASSSSGSSARWAGSSGDGSTSCSCSCSSTAELGRASLTDSDAVPSWHEHWRHAPDFELEDETGTPAQPRRTAGKGPVVLYFYPMAHDPRLHQGELPLPRPGAEFADAGRAAGRHIGRQGRKAEAVLRQAQLRLPAPLRSRQVGRPGLRGAPGTGHHPQQADHVRHRIGRR